MQRVLYRRETPVLHHRAGAGPGALVTKRSNPAAAAHGEQPGRLGSEHTAREQRKGRRDFRTLVSTGVEGHLIRIHCVITLARKREAEWNNK